MGLAVFSYGVTHDAVEISLLGITLRRIPFSNIEEVLLGAPGWNNETWTVFMLRGPQHGAVGPGDYPKEVGPD